MLRILRRVLTPLLNLLLSTILELLCLSTLQLLQLLYLGIVEHQFSELGRHDYFTTHFGHFSLIYVLTSFEHLLDLDQQKSLVQKDPILEGFNPIFPQLFDLLLFLLLNLDSASLRRQLLPLLLICIIGHEHSITAVFSAVPYSI